MRKSSGRGVWALGWAIVCTLLACSSALQSGEEPPAAPERGYEPWRFVSIPDFVNNDVAYPDPRWDEALDFVLSEIRKEDPDFVVVPGDLVMGRWSQDEEHLREMASIYYPAWIKRMDAHGLKYYAAVGDHEIGDNPWSASKAELVPLYEEAFRTYLKMPDNGPPGFSRLAYYVKHKNLLMVVLDTFEESDGGVEVTVSGEQLAWAEETLKARQPSDHAIVFGHVPILRTWVGRTSSRLHMAGGKDSRIWKVLRDEQVDLYLCGEIHNTSIRRLDGIHQITNGVNAAAINEFNYLVVTVYPDSLELEIKRISTVIEGPKGKRFDPYGEDPYTRRSIRIPEESMQSGMESVGTMAIVKSEGTKRFRHARGIFADRVR